MLIAPGCLAPRRHFVQSAEIPLMFKEIMFFLQCHFNKIVFYSSPSAAGSPFRTPCHYFSRTRFFFAWQILTGKGLYFLFSSCCLSVRAMFVECRQNIIHSLIKLFDNRGIYTGTWLQATGFSSSCRGGSSLPAGPTV